MSEPLLVNMSEVAAMMGVTYKAVCAMRVEDRLPAPLPLKAMGWRWRRSEIRDWIEAGCPDRPKWELMRGTATRQ